MESGGGQDGVKGGITQQRNCDAESLKGRKGEGESLHSENEGAGSIPRVIQPEKEGFFCGGREMKAKLFLPFSEGRPQKESHVTFADEEGPQQGG